MSSSAMCQTEERGRDQFVTCTSAMCSYYFPPRHTQRKKKLLCVRPRSPCCAGHRSSAPYASTGALTKQARNVWWVPLPAKRLALPPYQFFWQFVEDQRYRVRKRSATALQRCPPWCVKQAEHPVSRPIQGLQLSTTLFHVGRSSQSRHTAASRGVSASSCCLARLVLKSIRFSVRGCWRF